MSWAVPRTYVTGEVMRARYLNQDLRDSVSAAVGTFVHVQTSETTTSTAFTDLTTVGPMTTVVTAGGLSAFWGARVASNTSGGFAGAAVEVTDQAAVALAAGDTHALFYAQFVANRTRDCMCGVGGFALTPGPVTVKIKYRSSAGANTATFIKRWLLVYPTGPAT